MSGAWSRVAVTVALCIAAALLSACEMNAQDPQPQPPNVGTDPSPGSTGTSAPTTAVPQLFDHGRMQDAVHEILTEDYRIEDLGVVICPTGMPVVPDTSFTCTATIDGDQRVVRISVTSEEGDYTVGYPEE